ncbi:MAG: hypothetical protein OHK0044_02500 [Burkholderiaceae bacterium]
MNAVDPARPRQPQANRLEAALLESARAIRAVEERPGDKSPEVQAMLARCHALHARAREAAARKAQLVAYDCLQQIERELVLAMDEDARSAAFAVYLAEARALPDGWRRAAADALAEAAAGRVPSAAALQALMSGVHDARQDRRYAIEIVQRQAPLLLALLIASVVFFAAWALAGGFEWVMNEETEVTLAMVLVTGVLLGFFGGLLSVAFGAVRADPIARPVELRWMRAITIARPFIGAAMAVPIVLFLQSGLINLGSATPVLALVLCFVAGFAERRFVAQVERSAGVSSRAAQ